jgi:hypothetical protein
MATQTEDNTPLTIHNRSLHVPLTFGIEIQFAIAVLLPTMQDPHPHEGRNTHLIQDPFDTQGLGKSEAWWPWFLNICECVVSALEEQKIPAVTAQPKIAPTNPRAWTVCMDINVEGVTKLKDQYIWVPLEINSPAFVFSEAALNEVRIVVETLASTFRINCNRSSDIHVHVGNGDLGFDHTTMRNLFSTLWTFEPQFQTIIPSYRLTKDGFCPSYRTGTCCGYTKGSHWNRTHDPSCSDKEPPLPSTDTDDVHVRQGLEDLWATSEISHIRALNAPRNREATSALGYKMAYHMGKMEIQPTQEDDMCSRSFKPTVEFRQHYSTLSFPHIEAWIQFCVQIVQFAQAVIPGGDMLISFLRAHIDDTPETYPLEKVLRKLGMVSLAYKYPRLIEERIRYEKKTKHRVEKEELFGELWAELEKRWREWDESAMAEGMYGDYDDIPDGR